MPPSLIPRLVATVGRRAIAAVRPASSERAFAAAAKVTGSPGGTNDERVYGGAGRGRV